MKRRSRSLWISLLLAVILTIGSLAGCRSGGPAGSAKPQENASVLQTVTDDAEQENQEDLQQIEAEPESELRPKRTSPCISTRTEDCPPTSSPRRRLRSWDGAAVLWSLTHRENV